MPFDQEPPHYQHPVLRWIGHALGIVYILVTLLFGPIKLLARWLAQQRLIQCYEQEVASFSPAAGLAASLLSLSLLELFKITVLLSYRWFGLLTALVVTLCAKASIGYFTHLIPFTNNFYHLRAVKINSTTHRLKDGGLASGGLNPRLKRSSAD